MSLNIVNDKKSWDNFVATNGGDFLQSWAWGEFQTAVGYGVRRVALVDEAGEWLAVTTLITKPLGLGLKYWFSPRGPVIKSQGLSLKFQVEEFLFIEIKKIAVKEKVIFFRFEPTADLKLETLNLKLVQTLDIEPKQTIVLDLKKSEDELLGKMHQKTRYNIRLAEKKGVRVENSQDFAAWWELLKATAERDKFRLHAKSYYQKMLALPGGRLYLAKQDGQVLAGIFVVHFGSTATYVHGASANEGRELMAPYLLQWTASKEARTAGLTNYDFFGIDAVKWPGVTRFKEGFGGAKISYPGTFDLVVNRLYYRIYKSLRYLRRII